MFILQINKSISYLPAISSSYFQDCGTTFTVYTMLISLYTLIIKASALSTVVPDSRDLAIFMHIGGMLDNKKFAYSVPANDMFSVSFLVRKGRIRRVW